MELQRPQVSAQDLWSQGLALHQAGRLDEARQRYEAALAVDPRHFDSLHLLGVIGIQTGALEQGAGLIGQALAINPNVAAAHGNLANAFNGLGRHAEALASCDRAIALDPGHAESHGNRGLALYQLGRPAEALESFDRLVALRPSHAKAHCNRGIMLRDLKRLDEALAAFGQAITHRADYPEACYSQGVTLNELGRPLEALDAFDRAIALRPHYAEAWYNQGIALRELRRLPQALASYDQAIALKPDYAEAHSNRGNALSDLKRYEEALASYDEAVALKPDYAEAYSNRLIPLRELRRPEEALASCDMAVALQPDYAPAHNNRGNALYEFRRLEEVLACFDRAVALKPDYAEAYGNRGVMLFEMRRMAEALADYERAIALKPGYAEPHYNRAMHSLTQGDYARGWAQYEWRWNTTQFEEAVRDLGAPLWLGAEDLKGRTILLHAEQGLGDTLQFCRYVPQVAALGATVVLEVQAGLERLMARLEGVDRIVTRGQAWPPHDFQAPLMSLPLALGAGPDGDLGPYLKPDPDQAAAWAERLAGTGGLRVGLCWAGGARPDQPIAHAIDKRRSLPLEAFGPLAAIPGVTLYSLQKGPPAAQLLEVQARGWPGPPIVDLTGELKDFADTAALVANLDLVISCDTSTAHLAGGLGAPVWILNRFDACWRWLTDRDDSPWYPTARLFRQAAPGAWDGVIDRVTSDLSALAARGRRFDGPSE
jgi:tetratricopeptide (TPR) repeat protein